jgi:hypothetical protein
MWVEQGIVAGLYDPISKPKNVKINRVQNETERYGKDHPEFLGTKGV